MSEPLLSIEARVAGAIETAPDLLLVMVNGVEGISIPYSYEVTLYRPRKDSKGQPIPDLNPKELINTEATIGIHTLEGDNVSRFRRIGIFEHFEKAGSGTTHDDFRVYTGRIVPPFKMLDREVIYRVFENQDVVTILDTVLKGVPHLKTNMSRLRAKGLTFPKMEYCVQFGESTFAFLSRLMARFGIHYYFDHEPEIDTAPPQNDTMVFGGDGVSGNQKCQLNIIDIVKDEDYKRSKPESVYGVKQRFEPVFRSTRAGNFNIIDPTKPFTATRRINPGSDLVGSGSPIQPNMTTGPAINFRLEEFVAPVSSPEEAEVYVRHRQEEEETKVASILGKGGNRSFIPGRTIKIRRDAIHVSKDDKPENALEEKTFLLSWVSFTALDPSGRSFWSHLGTFLLDLVFRSAPAADVTAGIANGALNNYLQNEQQVAWDRLYHSPGKRDGAPGFFPNVFAGGVASAAGILENILPAIKNLAQALDGASYSNVFHATVTAEKLPLVLPSQGTRPKAYGPHLATVVGDKGSDPSIGDISADALGRVRVRFPWDTGPVRDKPSRDAFAVGTNTCWVRVAQGWAGRAFGSQFLPRIGNEVVVEFIDGDPERPIITGSVYNADSGVPNLPFAAFKDGPKPYKAEDLLSHTPLSTFQRSGIKTSITPPSKDKQGFHLLRFDDTRGGEQLLVRSQGRYDLTALHDHFDTTHGSRHVLVRAGRDDQGTAFGGGYVTTAGGEYDLHVGADRYEGVDGVQQVTVKGNTAFDLQGDCATIVANTASLNAATITLEAQAKITLKVGSSFVVVDPSGVFISGPMVQINSGGSPDSTADVEITDPADATMADPGDPPNFLDLLPQGGGGQRRRHTARAKHGFLIAANPDGTIQVTNAIRVAATDPGYASAVVADLSVISNTRNGKALLDDLDATGKSVLIGPLSPPPPSPSNALATPTDGPAAANETGSDSTVDYNPDQWPDPSTRTKAPGDVILFHELTKADHNAKGTRDTTPRADNFDDNEEFNTIGPENTYRDERGVPRRIDHHDL